MARSQPIQAIERDVATRVRTRRVERGLTQQQVADAIGVTYQQMHKYERGVNRISVGTFIAIARVLHTSPGELLDGAPHAGFETPGIERAVLEMARSFAAISDPDLRKAIAQTIHAAAGRTPAKVGEAA